LWAQSNTHPQEQSKPLGRSPSAVIDVRFDIDNTAMVQERSALLQRAEAELARGDSTAAIDNFDRAAMLLHAPDTEMGLVRAYMQAGEYRRALAFCAHTAGAHREAAAPGALYAWLLQAGGQNEFAQRTLTEALTRHPSHAVLLEAKAALANAQPETSVLLLDTPHRLAPFSVMQAAQAEPPATAKVVASGVLLASGQQALIPLHAVQDGATFWLRNGLGQATQAVLRRRLEALGLAVLDLQAPLPVSEKQALPSAPQDPFAGSPGYVVAHSTSPFHHAAWPWLHAGFHGAATQSGERLLGIDVPAASSGGLVLDAAGRWAGVALTDAQGRAVLTPISALRAALASSEFADASAALAGTASVRMTADLAYERALRFSLQVIASTR
jgi:tetratricopeptide (TPR) repeat protein